MCFIRYGSTEFTVGETIKGNEIKAKACFYRDAGRMGRYSFNYTLARVGVALSLAAFPYLASTLLLAGNLRYGRPGHCRSYRGRRVYRLRHDAAGAPFQSSFRHSIHFYNRPLFHRDPGLIRKVTGLSIHP